MGSPCFLQSHPREGRGRNGANKTLKVFCRRRMMPEAAASQHGSPGVGVGGLLKDAHSNRGTPAGSPCLPGFLLSGAVFPSQPPPTQIQARKGRGSGDQGCLLLSTLSSTPIMRARPLRRPINAWAKSTFLEAELRLAGAAVSQVGIPQGCSRSIKDVRSPEPRRSNLPHKQDAPLHKAGGG